MTAEHGGAPQPDQQAGEKPEEVTSQPIILNSGKDKVKMRQTAQVIGRIVRPFSWSYTLPYIKNKQWETAIIIIGIIKHYFVSWEKHFIKALYYSIREHKL